MSVMQEKKLETVEGLIRAGNGTEATRELRRLLQVRCPRPLALKLSQLAYRLHEPAIALRLLNPIVRSERELDVPATSAESALYGASLVRMGAFAEGLHLLESLSDEKSPEVLLYTSFAHMAEWNYTAALPPLRKYVERTSLTDYERATGRLNLAAALIYERHSEEALPLLLSLRNDAIENGYRFLLGNTLELVAQAHFHRRDWQRADACLDQATTLLSGMGGYAFFVEKWRVLLRLARGGASASTLALLGDVRSRAAHRGHWETVRDLDRHLALATGDAGVMQRVYFGTPYPHFRARLLAQARPSIELPENYLSHFPGEKSEKLVVLDVLQGEVEGKQHGMTPLKPGQILHRLLVHLAMERYRPLRVASLHYALYPGEYFNPRSSAARVHDAVQRLRRWIDDAGLGLRIDAGRGTFELHCERGTALRLQSEAPKGEKERFVLQRLQKAWPSEPFTVSQAGAVLGVHPRSALRLLSQAQHEGTLVRSGRGKGTRYRFAS